jgi:hypothetical protein
MAATLATMINVFSVSDAAVAIPCLLIIVLTIVTDSVSPSRRWTVVALLVASGAIAIINLFVDSGFVIPPRRFLVAAVYIAGGSKGLVLGWLSGLLLSKQLRRHHVAEVTAAQELAERCLNHDH